MPIITKIDETRRSKTRRRIYLDGRFAFACHLNVVAKFRLRQGMELTPQQVEAIGRREIYQECFDRAARFLQVRLHARQELKRKLMRAEYGEEIVEEVLNELERMNYLNDSRFAQTKAFSAAEHRKQGRRRAQIELLKAGVRPEVAEKAVSEVYSQADSAEIARQLALKQAPRLRKLDPAVARRRLVGMLQRRGFEYEAIKPLLDEVLGGGAEE